MIGEQELGVQKVGHSMNQGVSGNGDLMGKMAVFGGFFQSVPQKNQKKSADVNLF